MSHRVFAVDHHRNGMSGVGFTVALVHDGPRTNRVQYLVVDFDIDDGGERHTAVLAVDDIVAGNVFMHPQLDGWGRTVPGTGDAAFRGDVLGEKFREAITAALAVTQDRQSGRHARFDRRRRS